MSKIKIMSFNMRTQASGDGENQFLNRREFIAERLKELKPDVIGCQEMQPIMYDWLNETLKEYCVVGAGRGEALDNEAVCVAYRRDKFYLCSTDTFWLSPEPYKPGSRYTGDQSSCPRICTMVTLKPRDGAPFRLYNIHTDHVGKYARVLEVNQLLARIVEDDKKLKTPVFVTGDFNDTPDSLCIKTMLEYDGGRFTDLCSDSGQTFHAFGKYITEEGKIDYLFAENGTKCIQTEVIRDRRGNLYLSDHYPIMVEVEI